MTSPATRSASPAWVLFALAMGAFAIGTTEFAAMSLVPFFAADLGITEVEAGHAISAYALGVVVGAPLIAIFGARIRRRRLLQHSHRARAQRQPQAAAAAAERTRSV